MISHRPRYSRPRPICTIHLFEMRCAENDISVGWPPNVAGTRSSYFRGDRYECPDQDCTASVITGFGDPYVNTDEEGSLVLSLPPKKEPK